MQEWVKPHAWLAKGPPVPPCEPERLSTLYGIAPSGKLENLQHPKFGQSLTLNARGRKMTCAMHVLRELRMQCSLCHTISLFTCNSFRFTVGRASGLSFSAWR